MKRLAGMNVRSFLLVMIASATLQAQPIPKKLDDLCGIYYKRGILNGAILVADKGSVMYRNAFGLANIEWQVPNDLDTRFMLASVTKQFVAAITLKLVEEKKLRLEDTFGKYIPDYPRAVGDSVTIHQLLNHTSGIYSYTNTSTFGQMMGLAVSQSDVLKSFADSSLQFKPGTHYAYNNSGYFILGMVIEQVTGKPFADVLQEYILDPLGMKNTGFNVVREIMPKRAMGYDQNYFTQFANRNVWNESSLSTAGNMFSTVDDMLTWERGLMAEKIISRKSLELMFAPSTSIDSAEAAASDIDPQAMTSYGYGWFLGTAPLHGTNERISISWHSGTMSGYNAMIVRDPASELFVIVLNNVRVGREKLLALAIDCLNILHGKPPSPPRQSIAAALGVAIQRSGIAKALAGYPALKADSSNYALSESDINSLGYDLMRARRLKEAIEIFALNVREFPNSSNTYDSLGEAYMTDGNSALAIANYEKSLELDPKNEGGRRALEKLRQK